MIAPADIVVIAAAEAFRGDGEIFASGMGTMPLARTCAELRRVSAFCVSSTPASTIMRYSSQARFFSRSTSSRYSPNVASVSVSCQRCVTFPTRESVFTMWSVIAIASCPERPTRSTTSGIDSFPSDQVV